MRKSRGFRYDFCGILYFRLKCFERDLLMEICWFFFVRYDLNYFKVNLYILSFLFRCVRRMLWLIVLKVVLRLSMINKVIFWVFIFIRILFMILIRVVFVLWFLWYVDWNLGYSEWVIIWVCICLNIIFLVSFEIYCRLLIGL